MILNQKIIPIIQQDRLKKLKLNRILQQEPDKQLKLPRRQIQEPALHQTLLILKLGSRIDYDTATHPKRRHTRFRIDHNRADRDIEYAIAARLQQTDRAGVSAAWET